MSNLTKYVGNIDRLKGVVPFEGNGVMGDYVFDMSVDGAPKLIYANGDVTASGWTRSSVQSMVDTARWAYLTEQTFKKFFPKLMAVLQIPALPASRPLSIKKGSLYFNTTSARVERVIAIVDGSLIWTSRHKQKAEAYPRSAFRLANQVEVDAYLNEARIG